MNVTKVKKKSNGLDFADELQHRIDKLIEEREFYLSGIHQRLTQLEKQTVAQEKAIDHLLDFAAKNNAILRELNNKVDVLLSVTKGHAIATIASIDGVDN